MDNTWGRYVSKFNKPDAKKFSTVNVCVENLTDIPVRFVITIFFITLHEREQYLLRAPIFSIFGRIINLSLRV